MTSPKGTYANMIAAWSTWIEKETPLRGKPDEIRGWALMLFNEFIDDAMAGTPIPSAKILEQTRLVQRLTRAHENGWMWRDVHRLADEIAVTEAIRVFDHEGRDPLAPWSADTITPRQDQEALAEAWQWVDVPVSVAYVAAGEGISRSSPRWTRFDREAWEQRRTKWHVNQFQQHWTTPLPFTDGYPFLTRGNANTMGEFVSRVANRVVDSSLADPTDWVRAEDWLTRYLAETVPHVMTLDEVRAWLDEVESHDVQVLVESGRPAGPADSIGHRTLRFQLFAVPPSPNL